MVYPVPYVTALCHRLAFEDIPIFLQAAATVTHCMQVFTKEKAETHNFPTTVEPFNGASTGTGGEIRDRMGGGKGSWPIFVAVKQTLNMKGAFRYC